MAITVRVQTPDVAELRRDLESVRLGLGRAIAKAKRQASQVLAAETATNTPVGPGPRRGAKNPNDRLPHIRDTIRASASGVVSRHPAALVHEYGGTISPHGGSIRIRASEMGLRAAGSKGGEAERLLLRELDELMRNF